MATTSSIFPNTRNSLLRTIVLGGMLIFIIQFIHQWVVVTLIQGNPFILVWQYIASGVLGDAAFAGGIATALLGVGFHLIFSFVIAGIFTSRPVVFPSLNRYIRPAPLWDGLGVSIVMNLVVVPLSAAPPLPAPTTPWLIEAVIEHILGVGLPLGILVRRYATRS